ARAPRRADPGVRSRPRDDAAARAGGRRAARPALPVGRRYGRRESGLRHRPGAARRGRRDRPLPRPPRQPDSLVLRDRPGLRAVEPRRCRPRPGDARGALLRRRAPLPSPAGEHRRRLHRARVPLRRAPGAAGGARGPPDGQAARRPHGSRRLLHEPHGGGSERPREPRRAARRRRLQLLHGRAHGRRLHARLPDVVLPRRAGPARAARPAPGARVRGLAGDARAHGGRTADGPGRRPAGARVILDLERARRSTPARLGVGRTGARPPTAAWLAFQADHAAARDAVWSEWSAAFLARLRGLGFVLVASAAQDRLAYIREPPRGRRLAAGELERIRAATPHESETRVAVSDGLSGRAAETQLERLWPALCDRLARLGRLGTPVAVRNGRVAVADVIAAAAGARLVVHLIGERPGLGSADSLGCYVTLRPGPPCPDADRKCIPHIRPRAPAPP